MSDEELRSAEMDARKNPLDPVARDRYLLMLKRAGMTKELFSEVVNNAYLAVRDAVRAHASRLDPFPEFLWRTAYPGRIHVGSSDGLQLNSRTYQGEQYPYVLLKDGGIIRGVFRDNSVDVNGAKPLTGLSYFARAQKAMDRIDAELLERARIAEQNNRTADPDDHGDAFHC